MPKLRPYVLTIGGFDPSGGAGVLSDIKTFEQFKLQGMAVNTANTVQTEDSFEDFNWVQDEIVLSQLRSLLGRYSFSYAKVGLISSMRLLQVVLEELNKFNIKVVWDPVLSITAGGEVDHKMDQINEVCDKVFMVTPNLEEVEKISGFKGEKGGEKLSQNALVYLKGGHASDKEKGRDDLFVDGKLKFSFTSKSKSPTDKHGTGCVLSSALVSTLTLDYPLKKACLKAKQYVSDVLESNQTLLGYHKK